MSITYLQYCHLAQLSHRWHWSILEYCTSFVDSFQQLCPEYDDDDDDNDVFVVCSELLSQALVKVWDLYPDAVCTSVTLHLLLCCAYVSSTTSLYHITVNTLSTVILYICIIHCFHCRPYVKIQDGAQPQYWKPKIRNISTTVQPIMAKFCVNMQIVAINSVGS